MFKKEDFNHILASKSFAEPRAKYRDYHSIDWLRELSRDKGRHARLEREKTTGTLQEESSNFKTNSYLNFHAVGNDLWTTFESQTNLKRFCFYLNLTTNFGLLG